MKYTKLLVYCLIYSAAFYSCSPKLNISEIEQRINKNNTALFEGDVEYLLKNIPKKYLKKNSEDGLRKQLHEIYDDRKHPVGYRDIGELVIMKEGKCNSFYYYKVNYRVTRSQMTPYLDSAALKLNETEYGKKHVVFNSNSKILHVTEKKHLMLIFDKDRNWKILDYDKQSLNENYGNGFWECIQSKDGNTD